MRQKHKKITPKSMYIQWLLNQEHGCIREGFLEGLKTKIRIKGKGTVKQRRVETGLIEKITQWKMWGNVPVVAFQINWENKRMVRVSRKGLKMKLRKLISAKLQSTCLCLEKILVFFLKRDGD